ncbi:acyltransferase family protein [Tenacibaculum haliotis]|uniref:acyltransferase family protein n=1 Tax=Tenacibaculum haliotis TaxID=1888914 RepID=UPI0021B08371|nr:DUF5009 domain-containing protein [Tenacibaculum haliotis]MCT4699994.1 DUF5009 domain-containing protein [Tenacibaculum haliotis]
MNKRLLSIDILRGLTIFFMIIVNTPGSWSYVYPPLLHAKWNGCTPADLVFPSFLFVIGMSLFISFKKMFKLPTAIVVKKITKRAFLIFLIGLFLNWFPFYNTPFTELRYFGVLQRIALAFFFAGLLIILLKRINTILLASISLLLVHWGILFFFGEADNYLTLKGNIGGYLDIAIFGEAHLYKGYGLAFDPEGLLGTLSSISQILLGYFITSLALSKERNPLQKMKYLLLIASVMLILALIWDNYYPINKSLWTGSYVLFTSSILLFLWIILMFIIDYKKITSWTFTFNVFGINPLISYTLSILFIKIFASVILFKNTNLYAYLYNAVFQPIFGNKLGSLLFAFTFTFFIWLFAYWLYKKNKIIKI